MPEEVAEPNQTRKGNSFQHLKEAVGKTPLGKVLHLEIPSSLTLGRVEKNMIRMGTLYLS